MTIDTIAAASAARTASEQQRRSDQAIDPAVGLSDIVELGAQVPAGAPLLRIHARDADAAKLAAERIGDSIRIVDANQAPPQPPLIWQRIGVEEVE